MEVIVAKTAGFCFGVKRAVEKVYANVDKEHVYTYGPIIHNEQVVADLEMHGVRVVEENTDLTQLPEGTIVVRAHGASRAEFDRLRECGMQIEDATCPFVSKIYRIVEEESKAGRTVIIVGNAAHPEVRGIRGWSGEDTYVVGSIEEANNKKFRFTLTTNGILLNDEILDFANKEMSNIVLSIDGRKEINDLMRPTRNNHGSSYDIIMPKFKKVAESRNQNNYYVRGTFTHNNLDFANDVLHLADEGFEQISVEPVVAQPTDDYAIRPEDVPFICEQYDLLAKELVKRKKAGNGFNFFHFMIDLNGGPCVAKRLSGCGSGCEYLAVTPWGDFYPCHQFVGNEDFLMGNVDDGITRTDIRDMFKNSNVYSKEKCKNCFAKFYCSGGCAANSYNFHGNINDAYDIGCDLQRKRIECAIMIKAALAND